MSTAAQKEPDNILPFLVWYQGEDPRGSQQVGYVTKYHAHPGTTGPIEDRRGTDRATLWRVDLQWLEDEQNHTYVPKTGFVLVKHGTDVAAFIESSDKVPDDAMKARLETELEAALAMDFADVLAGRWERHT